MAIDQIREFVKIAEEGSFTKAALALNMTQPALSKHMVALEKRLGAKLLVRSNVRTTLTPAGEVFYDDAQNILQAYDTAVEHLHEAARTKPMSLTVQSFVGYKPSDDLLVAMDMDFKRDRRLIELTSLDITARSALDTVREGDVDLCLVSHFDDVDLTALDSVELVTDPFVAIVRTDHPLAVRDAIWMRDIGSDVVWTYTSPGVRTYFGAMEQILVRNGASPRFMPLPWTNARKLYNSFAFFEGGIHVNLGSVVKFSVPLALKGYKVLRFLDEDAYLPLYAHWRRDSTNPAIPLAVESFRDTVAHMEINPYWE